MKKKVLVFNGYYLPAKNYGGPTTSMVNIVNTCSDAFDFYIVAANHDLHDPTPFPNVQPGWNQVGRAKVLYAETGKLIHDVDGVAAILKEVQPDAVWLVGILTPFHWTQARACRKLGIPYLISPRGEVCVNTFHMKYAKKKLAADYVRLAGIYKNAFYHATSEEERDGLIKYYGAPAERIMLVPNIPKVMEAAPRKIEKQPGDLRLVFISRMQEKKNLLTAVRAVSKMQGKVVFDLYGPMESPDYWAQCQAEIIEKPGVQIRYCGQLKPEQVSETYRQYHAFFFPTKSENYGHAIVEALAVSCPVVLSRSTTPWDDLDGRAGFVCGLEDVDAYVQALSALQAMDQSAYDALMASTKTYFDSRMQADDAVSGHIQMLTTVIEA